MPLNERTINAARNPKWADPEHSSIDLEVDFDELDEEYVDFNAHPDDIISWGPELYNRAVAGEFGTVAEWVAPPDITGDLAMQHFREKRDQLLKDDLDPIVTNPLRWETLSAEKQQEWKNYRQALLDLPQNYTAPVLRYNSTTGLMDWVNIDFPTKPE